MTKLTDLELHPPKILLMGNFGTGKTVLATTVGEIGQVLDLDNGLLSARNYIDKFTSERHKIDVKKCWEEDHKKAISYKKLLSFVNTIYDNCAAKTYDFEVVILDNFTVLADVAMQETLADAGRLGQTPQIQHWGTCFAKMQIILNVLKSLPLVVIVIAHTRRVEDGGASKYEIACPGQKLPEKVPTYFDEVWWTEVIGTGNNVKYQLRTKPTGQMPARSRLSLPDPINQNDGMLAILETAGWTPKAKGVEK